MSRGFRFVFVFAAMSGICGQTLLFAPATRAASNFSASSIVTPLETTTTTLAPALTCLVTFRLADDVNVGAIQWTTDYGSAPGDMDGEGVAVSCAGLVGNTIYAFFDEDASRTLTSGLISNDGFGGPVDIARCAFSAASVPAAEDFDILVTEAADADVAPLPVLPSVQVSDVECVGMEVTTTTSTLPPDGTVSYEIHVSLDAATDKIGSLQLDLDYLDAPGELQGEAAEVKCANDVEGALFARNDADFSRRATLGWIRLNGFSAPTGLATCRFTGSEETPPIPSDFGILNIVMTDPVLKKIPGRLCIRIVPGDAEPYCRGYCGDGAIDAAKEECDDGNDLNTDACTAGCKAARCGDGIVHAGVEQCDDANTLNDDSCRNDCTMPYCGDGTVDDTEECEDGNTADGDGCSAQCEFQQRCGDSDDDGVVDATDALATLKSAVGLPTLCPTWICDNDDNDTVTANDSLRTLHEAVGLNVTLRCGQPTSLLLYLIEGTGVEAMSLDVYYPPRMDPTVNDLPVDCQSLSGGVLVTHLPFSQKLRFAVTDVPAAPSPIARCAASFTGSVGSEDFTVVVFGQLPTNAGSVVMAVPD